MRNYFSVFQWKYYSVRRSLWMVLYFSVCYFLIGLMNDKPYTPTRIAVVAFLVVFCAFISGFRKNEESE